MTGRVQGWGARRVGLALLVFVAAWCLGPWRASAHQGPPLRLILLRLEPAGTYALASLPRDAADPAAIAWPGDCTFDALRRRLRCAAPLDGRAVAPGASFGTRDVLVVVAGGGATATAMLTPGAGAARFEVASVEGAMPRSLFVAGLRHIAGGWDHLAFVGMLALGAASLRRLFADVTGFTVGHAMSLALAVGLGATAHPITEVLIALSVVLLARDVLVSPDRGHPRAAQAAAFGLVHGLGFAGAFADVPAGAGARALALAGFHAGIEVGQILFVLPVFAAWYLLRARPAGRALRVVAAYAAGTAGFAAVLLRFLSIVRS